MNRLEICILMAEDVYAACRRDKNADVRSLQQLKHDADEVAGGLDTANQGRIGEAGMCWHLTASMATRDMLSGCVCEIAYECDFDVLQGERDRLRWADDASCRVCHGCSEDSDYTWRCSLTPWDDLILLPTTICSWEKIVVDLANTVHLPKMLST